MDRSEAPALRCWDEGKRRRHRRKGKTLFLTFRACWLRILVRLFVVFSWRLRLQSRRAVRGRSEDVRLASVLCLPLPPVTGLGGGFCFSHVARCRVGSRLRGCLASCPRASCIPGPRAWQKAVSICPLHAVPTF